MNSLALVLKLAVFCISNRVIISLSLAALSTSSRGAPSVRLLHAEEQRASGTTASHEHTPSLSATAITCSFRLGSSGRVDILSP